MSVFKAFAEIAQSLVEKIIGPDKKLTDLNPGSIIRNKIEGVSDVLEKHYVALRWSLDQAFAQTAEDENLDKIVARRGLTRQLAKKAVHRVTLGKSTPVNADYAIQAGMLVTTMAVGDNIPVQFETVTDATIPAGQQVVEVSVICTEYGAMGNVGPGQINLPGSPGIDTVTGSYLATEGLDKESNESLRERYFIKVRKPVTSGNKAHYVVWAQDILGPLAKVHVQPLWNGRGTVRLFLLNQDIEPATPEQVQAVQEYIDPGPQGEGEGQAPVGAIVTCVATPTLEVSVTASVNRNTTYTLEQVTAALQADLAAYFKEIVYKESVIRYNRIGAILIDTDGVIDHSDLLINGGYGSIEVPVGHIAVVGTVNLIEV